MKKYLLAGLALLVMGCSSGATPAPAGDDPPGPVSTTVVSQTTTWDGSALPAYPDGTPKVTLLRITVPPKTKLDLHLHPVINVGYMTRGELIVTSEAGDKLHLREGEGIVELVDTYHYGENPGDESAEIIVFYVGNTESTLTQYK